MAPPADESAAPHPVRGWLALLAPTPGRLEFATRQTLICALTALVVAFYGTPDAALTVYIVFFLNKADRATSLVMNLVFLVLITVIIALTLGMTVLVIDAPLWRLASIAGLSFGFLFLTSASKLRPVGSILALIVGYALDLLGSVHIGEIATRALLYAWLFVGIPAGVSIVINLLIAPPPRRLAQRGLSHRLRACAAVLRADTPSARQAFAAVLAEGLGGIPGWLKLTALERTAPAADIAALRQAAESAVALMLLVDLAIREPDMALAPPLRERIARTLDEMAAILADGGYPVEIRLEPGADEAGLSAPAASLLADLRATLHAFAQVPPAPPSPNGKKAPGGFFLPDAFTNPEHVQYALKTTAAALFCYILYQLLDWPGIHTCFITCYIVALSTTAESVEKLALRLIGCMLGAATGIAALITILPMLTSAGGLMLIIAVGGFCAAWVAGGGPRIAYAGFQFAFAFFLCVLQGPAPAFDMVVARDRVIGILVGNIVSYVVFVHLWPVSIARRIDSRIADMLRTMGLLVAAPSVSARRTLAASVLTAQAAAGQDLALVAYEPTWVRSPSDWRARRARSLGRLSALLSPLLLAADETPDLSPGLAPRLNGLAQRFASPQAHAAAAPIDGGAAAVAQMPPPLALAERHLADLEQTIADDGVPKRKPQT